MLQRKRFLSLLLLLLLPCVGLADGLPWIDCADTALVDDKRNPFRIQCISIGMEDVWQAKALPLRDLYDDMACMGFNAVTLHLDYALLENDASPYVYRQEGFDCIDQHVKEAAAHGMYVILNMDRAQSSDIGGGPGSSLWCRPAEQNRLIALWSAIAAYYANQPCVLGYSLFDEPLPEAASAEEAFDAWSSLAGRIIAGIRASDERHLIFLEQCTNYTDLYSNEIVRFARKDLGFPQIEDSRTVLQFQQFQPHAFTEQPWSDPADTPYLTYPSEWIADLRGGVTRTILTTENEPFDIGEPYWDKLYSERFTVEDPLIRYVRPCVSLWDMGVSGAVWIDEMVLDEYDAEGNFLRQALHLSFQSETIFHLYAEGGMAVYVPTGGMNGEGGTLYIEGVQSGYAVLEAACVPVRQHHSYQLSLVIGGTNLAYSSTISPMLEFSCGGEPYRMNREYLESVLQPYVDYAVQCRRPLYVGGFGTNLNSFHHGGMDWVRDMDAMYSEKGINCNYFIYRNDYFGVYQVDGTVNQPLHDYFVERQRLALRER